jgi:GABA permease
MESTTQVLVVANRTADSDELFNALQERARRGSICVTLLVPQDSRGGMGKRLNAGLKRLHGAGIDAVGMLGDVDPIIAVQEEFDAESFDEVIVSTLPSDESRWIELDLPDRIAKVTGAPVTHVVSTEVAPFAPAPTG